MPKKKKGKNYMVTITAYSHVLVENAESEEKAMEYARDAVSQGDFEIDETEIDCEIKQDQFESAKRNANCVAQDL